jgi:Cof subfamily protein (haloacid dehalogenase superfamily)
MAYRLLALDIDGTLLNDDKQVTDATDAAIRQAMDRGVWVTLCTGRSMATVLTVTQRLPLNAPLVLNGGALIFDMRRRRALYVRNLARRQTIEAVHRLRALGCHPVVYSPLPESRHFYYDHDDPDNPVLREYVAKNPGRAQKVSDVIEALGSASALVAVSDRTERIRSLAPAVQSCLPETTVTLEISPIDPAYCHLTLTPAGVSKGSGLRELACLLGVDLADTIAVGDNLNDLDMLRAAGLGVAMGNATPEARAHADHVTASNNEDGVAEVIARFILRRTSCRTG